MVAYLLFRIADTIEDGEELDREEKLAALQRFADLLGSTEELAVGEALSLPPRLDLPRPPSRQADYLALLAELPVVIRSLIELRPAVRSVIIRSVLVTLSGMRQFIAAGTPRGKIQLASLSELREYCYFVAGVVGEMLTEIFLQSFQGIEPVRTELKQHARWFGEGLQLVNILKDADDDRANGRVFIPPLAAREELFAWARQDLQHAESYVAALKRSSAPREVIVFTELPLLLAWRTLECVEKFGAGSKVPRAEVMSILAETVARPPARKFVGRSKGVAAE